jgi:hypothetical protein
VSAKPLAKPEYIANSKLSAVHMQYRYGLANLNKTASKFNKIYR